MFDDETLHSGADSSCSENDNSICNGALPSDRRYIFAYQGATLAGLSELTLYGPISAPFPITRSPRGNFIQIVDFVVSCCICCVTLAQSVICVDTIICCVTCVETISIY